MKRVFFCLMILAAILLSSCKTRLNNMVHIDTHIDFTIYPNSIEYLELNAVGGWMYLTGSGDSYGIIVYRKTMDEFMAYDRKPVELDSVCPNNRLNVNGFYLVDECHDQKYVILTGYNINGDGTHPYWYVTTFDGTTLRVHN